MAEETLKGRIARILYRDESDGYSVFDLEGEDGLRKRVLGKAPLLEEGLEVRVTGDYYDHPRWGRQIRATSIMTLPPEKPEAIGAYLASGKVQGIGKGIAEQLVSFFGPRLREVLDGDEKGLMACPGIGPKRARAIHEAWHSHKRFRDTYVLLASFGLTERQILKIMHCYGEEGPAKVSQDPYDLIRKVPGIGFRTADAIGRKVGIAKDSEERLMAAIEYCLEEALEYGHCYLFESQLVEKVSALTELDEGTVRRAVERALSKGIVIREEEGGQPIIFSLRLHRAEVETAQRLKLLASQNLREVPWQEELVQGIRLSESQRAAVAKICRSPVSVLTGGPGTGKTTVVSTLIRLGTTAGMKVALAAPTGRASMRLREATGFEAKTLHRLLEFNPRSGEFSRNESNPLDVDWVIVDEASMLDIEMFSRLLRALTPMTRLTLVGDGDQLPPVGPGDPFRDVITSGIVPVARLREVFRQGEGSEIIQAAAQILRGEKPVSASKGASRIGDFYVVYIEDAQKIGAMVQRLVVERIPKRLGLDPLRDIQALAPMHKGDCGTDALNRLLRERLNPRAREGSGLFEGDRVIQTVNNYTKDVYNGDVGIVTARREDGTVQVEFANRVVEFEPHETDDLALAYAVSVHKAQGSEFPCVVIAMHTQHYMMLRRNLLYTAVTRAKRLCVVVTSRKALGLALANDRVEGRNTLLQRRLREGL